MITCAINGTTIQLTQAQASTRVKLYRKQFDTCRRLRANTQRQDYRIDLIYLRLLDNIDNIEEELLAN